MSEIPVVVHGDPERAIIDRLMAIWADIDEPFAPPAQNGVGTDVPVTLIDQTFIQVHHEAVVDLGVYPARERSQTRITCWVPKGKRTWAKAFASRTQGELIASAPDAPDVGQGCGFIRPLGGRSGVVDDPDTTNLGVWFLVKTNIRGKQL